MKALGPIALATAIGCAAGGSSGTGSSSTGAGTTSGGTPFGSVQFSWTFATDSTPLTCAAAGASTIVIVLEGNQITFPCLSADGGQTGTADGIAAGDVPYQATALAADGVTQVAAGMPADVEVTAGQTVAAPIALVVPDQVGAVAFTWTFGGLDCVQAGVSELSIRSSSLSMAPAWVFPCQAFGDGGMSGLIEGVPVGPQTFTVQALGEDLITLAPDLDVTTGAVPLPVTTGLTPTVAALSLPAGSSRSAVQIQWTFQGSTCAVAGNPEVSLTFAASDAGDASLIFPCTDAGFEGTVLQGLSAGTYGVALQATSDAGSPPFSAAGTFFVNGLSDELLAVDFEPQTDGGLGALAVTYSFGTDGSCGDAGVTAIETELFEPSGAVVQPLGAGDVVTPCGSLPVVFDSLSPGVYWIEAQGLVGDAQAYLLYGFGLSVVPGATSTYSVLLPAVTP